MNRRVTQRAGSLLYGVKKMEEKLFTQQQFRELTGMSRKTQWLERKAGRLAYLRTGGGRDIRYRESHIEEYLRRCERPAKVKA
jgi:predicted DNA-binding transcriptional regulator AlpA